MKRPEEDDPLPFKFRQASDEYHVRQERRKALLQKVNENLRTSEETLTASMGYTIYGLRSAVDAAANKAAKQALKNRVDTALASVVVTAAAEKTPQWRKQHLADRVQAALVTANAADPLLDFSCGCEFHQSVVTGPDSLTASIVWAA